MKVCLSLLMLLSTVSLFAQTKPEPCTKDLSFCWFENSDGDDSITASGDIWIAQDKAEKPIDISVEIRCFRKLKFCTYGYSQTFGKKIITKVDLLDITHWDSNQVTLRGPTVPCEIDTFTINKLDKTVFMMSAPGNGANRSSCKGVLGEPKTIIYKLSSKP